MHENASNTHDFSKDNVISDMGIPSDDGCENRICVLLEKDESVVSICTRLQVKLESQQLVFHPYVGESPLQKDLFTSDSLAKHLLCQGLHRVVVLDVAQGFNAKGEFDLGAIFYPYVFQQLMEASGSPPLKVYNEQYITQLLIDLPQSLICCVNVHLASSLDRKRLRCLTQECHKALIIYRTGEEIVSASTTSPANGILRGISAPVAGVEFSLDRETTTLGRQDHCEIVIEVGAVSREHARISRDNDGFILEDLKSRNGTYQNGVKVESPIPLNSGDHIRICDVLFVYEDSCQTSSNGLKDEDETHALVIADDFDDFGTVSTFDEIGALADAPSTESPMTASDGSDASSSQSVSSEVKLKALLNIERGLGTTIALDDVLPKLLDDLFVAFPSADRGLVILTDPRTGGLVPKAVKSRDPNVEEFRVSRTIVETAMSAKEAILSSDASQDSRFDASESIVHLDIHSLICAPLLDSNGDAMGVLQINSIRRGKRFIQEDMELLASVANLTARSIELAQLREVALHEQALDRELDIARKVQRSFLPSEQPTIESYEFFDSYEAAKYLGGDYYDYAILKDGRVAIILGDVSGRGVSASLFMVKLAAEMRYHLVAEENPTDVMKALNLSFCHERWAGRFVTLMMAVLDPTTHSLILVNAGHMQPLVRSDDASVEEIEFPIGLPLGIDEDAEYEEFSLSLTPGQAFMMYSDGLPDAMNSEEDWFGDERLRDAFGQPDMANVEDMGKEVQRQVQEFVGRHPQFDDRCLLIFRRSS